ncbi:MAG: prenyltransferase [Chloroflexi bacterium]|nr:prenyltransferase [Chloroflexota bacterium]
MINFKMWKTALTTIPNVSQEEWTGLDVVSRWLVMTRSAVTTVTVFSCIVAGLLAWRAGGFHFLPWLIVTIGLFIAHGTNNILNDYTDFARGVDTDSYFRTLYGPHPLVHGFHDKKTQLVYFVISGILAMAAGVYALFYTNFDPIVLNLFVIGALTLLFYTWPLKHIALGEIAIFLIWGPIMIAGVYYVLTLDWSWSVVLASIPVGLGVVSINLAKHIDKMEEDRKKRVTTLPVLIGQTAARMVDIVALLATYGLIVYLVFWPRYFTPVMLIVFLAGKWLFYSVGALSKPRPAEPPKEWTAWPIWFAGFTFMHNRNFILLFMLGLIVDTILHVFHLAGWWG